MTQNQRSGRKPRSVHSDASFLLSRVVSSRVAPSFPSSRRFALGPYLMNSSPLPSPYSLSQTPSSSSQSLLTLPGQPKPSASSSTNLPPSSSLTPRSSSESDDSEREQEYAPLVLFPAPISLSHSSSRSARTIRWLRGAINPPLQGGILAMVFGVIGPVRRVVFERGWGGWVDPITQSLFKLGGLFSAFQM